MTQARIDALGARHARIEGRLHEELGRPHPDQAACSGMKREKLAVKDEMARAAR